MVISPNPNVQSHPGGGPVTFNFTATPSGGTGPFFFAWSTGDTSSSISFNELAFASDETDGMVSVTVTDSSTPTPQTANDSAEWITHGF